MALPTVTADASHTAVDHLDGTEQDLQHTHAQQYGEQHNVPQYNIFRVFTDFPKGLIPKVAGISPAKESRLFIRTHFTDLSLCNNLYERLLLFRLINS